MKCLIQYFIPYLRIKLKKVFVFKKFRIKNPFKNLYYFIKLNYYYSLKNKSKNVSKFYIENEFLEFDNNDKDYIILIKDKIEINELMNEIENIKKEDLIINFNKKIIGKKFIIKLIYEKNIIDITSLLKRLYIKSKNICLEDVSLFINKKTPLIILIEIISLIDKKLFVYDYEEFKYENLDFINEKLKIEL